MILNRIKKNEKNYETELFKLVGLYDVNLIGARFFIIIHIGMDIYFAFIIIISGLVVDDGRF